ncbi:unnamed protein product, partial [Prunus brigantina]
SSGKCLDPSIAGRRNAPSSAAIFPNPGSRWAIGAAAWQHSNLGSPLHQRPRNSPSCPTNGQPASLAFRLPRRGEDAGIGGSTVIISPGHNDIKKDRALDLSADVFVLSLEDLGQSFNGGRSAGGR